MFAHTNYVIYDDPHVCLVTLSGFRVREAEMLALGMSLPGLAQRAGAIAGLPALGLLTLAALTPAPWTQSYHEAPKVDEALVASVLGYQPALVAISALTAAIGEAYSLADTLRNEGVRVVLGGLHVTAMPDEALSHADAVVVGEGEPHWAALLADARAGRLRARYEGAGSLISRGHRCPGSTCSAIASGRASRFRRHAAALWPVSSAAPAACWARSGRSHSRA